MTDFDSNTSLYNFLALKTKTLDSTICDYFNENEPTGTVKLNQVQKETLVGLMLGDGHLFPSQAKHNRDNPATYKLVILQSDEHKDYVFHLYEIFKPLTQTPPKYYEFSDSRNPGKIYKRWSFGTIMQPCLRFYGQKFYQYDKLENKYHRVVPDDIQKLLKARSLAYWYMDDGAAKWQGKSFGMRFCTDSFKLDEVKRLITCLENKFLLKCSEQKQRENTRIYIKDASYYVIKGLMFEFLIESMVYKFPREYEKKKKDKRSAVQNNIT